MIMPEQFDYDYRKMDPVKKAAMEKFRSTLHYPERLGIRVMPAGETAAVLDFVNYDFMLAFNVEGLGTKNAIDDEMYAELREKAEIGEEISAARFYRTIGQDALAMSVNDLLAVGADPIAYGDFLTAGADSWFEDMERIDELLEGYKAGADIVLCAIPLGETPVLPGSVYPETLVLEGASVGLIRPKDRFVSGRNVREGDTIYGLRSSGVHANGISKTRKIASRLPNKFFTRLPSGTTYGEELLTPTELRYVRAVHEMFNKGAEIHMLQPITGHGWTKIMRPGKALLYEIEEIPDPHEIFYQMIEWGNEQGLDVTPKTNYYTWNMGLGYVAVGPASSWGAIRSVSEYFGLQAYQLGSVKSSPDKNIKEVRIVPLNVQWTENVR